MSGRQASHSGKPASPGRVLVMDDEPNLLETMGIILESSGYEVSCAATVPAAMALVRAGECGVLLADLCMPSGDSTTVMAAMRQAKPEALILVITGYIMSEAIPAAVRALADAILFKPLEIPELLARLAAGRRTPA